MLDGAREGRHEPRAAADGQIAKAPDPDAVQPAREISEIVRE
jgi:hypothetical protein